MNLLRSSNISLEVWNHASWWYRRINSTEMLRNTRYQYNWGKKRRPCSGSWYRIPSTSNVTTIQALNHRTISRLHSETSSRLCLEWEAQIKVNGIASDHQRASDKRVTNSLVLVTWFLLTPWQWHYVVCIYLHVTYPTSIQPTSINLICFVCYCFEEN